jgi:hypothetical protein
MTAPVHLHIERLVVDGLPLTVAQAARLQRAVERELARLIVQGGDAHGWASGAAPPSAPARPAPAVPWDATRPHQLGRAVARDVFASISGGSPRAFQP